MFFGRLLCTLSGFGDIKFYGDVEFNMDAASKTGSLTSVKQNANSDWAPGDKERWDINGRILLGFDGYRKMDNGHFSGFSVQPSKCFSAGYYVFCYVGYVFYFV